MGPKSSRRLTKCLPRCILIFVNQMRSHEREKSPINRTIGSVRKAVRSTGTAVVAAVGVYTAPLTAAVGALGWLKWKNGGKSTLETLHRSSARLDG